MSLGRSTTSNGGEVTFPDLATILNAAQAISEEIDLDRLRITLTRVIAEQIGAERAVFVWAGDAELTLAAEYYLGQVSGWRSPCCNLGQTVPLSLITKVKQTGKAYAIADVSQLSAPANQPQMTRSLDEHLEEAWEGGSVDAYFSQQHPRSVLCLPIFRHPLPPGDSQTTSSGDSTAGKTPTPQTSDDINSNGINPDGINSNGINPGDINSAGMILGVLYFEHYQWKGAFTDAMLAPYQDSLHFLVAQAAIALDHALHRRQLEDRARALEQQLAEQSQRLQQEMSVRKQAEKMFERAFYASPYPVAIANYAEGRYIEVNHSLCQLIGYPREHVIGYTTVELNLWVTLDDRMKLRQLLQDPGRFLNLEVRLRTQTDEIKIVLMSAELIEIDGIPCILSVMHDISDRKRSEAERKQAVAKLRKSEAALASAQRVAHVGSWEYDVKTGEQHWSEELFRIFGLDPTQPTPNYATMLQYIHPDDREMVDRQNTLEQCRVNGSFQQFEHRIVRADGAIRHVEVRGETVLDETGAVEKLFGTVIDITERQQVEESLRLSQAHLANAQRIAHIGSWEFDPLTGKNNWSDELFHIFGLDPTQGEPSYEELRDCSVHPDDRCLWQTMFDQGMTGYMPIELEHRIIRPDDSIRYVEVRTEPIFNQYGKLLRLFGTTMDITERKQAEIALRAAEERWQLVLKANNDGIWDWDKKNHTMFRSNRWKEIMGYAEEDVLDDPDEWLRCIHPDDCDRIAAIHQAYLHRKIPQYAVEYRAQCKDGTYKWVQVRGQAIWDDAGTPIRLVGSTTDISERKQAEENLRQAKSLADAASQAKDEFLANMSHELRTPLTSILGLSEVLQAEMFGALNPRQYQYISTIIQSGKHLLELINDILDLAKIESGKMDLHLGVVALHPLCHASLNFIQPMADDKQISLNLAIADDVEVAELDERRMRQVLINLLSNAVKFTPSGGRVELTVESDSAHSVLRFSVSDTGIGIAPADVEQLFQPFVQIDSSYSRRYAGTGLGLTLVRRVVELHGGSISVESEVGKGSRFTVSLAHHHSS